MCGMCGLWGGREDHWSDVSKLPGGRPSEHSVTRSRQAQATLLTRFTRPGAVVRDWGSTAWLVEGRSGGTEIVASLGEVWAAVARLTGKPLDPLDLALIQSFERAAPR